MAKRYYPYIDSADQLVDFSKDIARIREEDIEEFSNLKNVLMSGRKVGKTPSSSSDIEDTDRVGDFNYDANYMYLCVDNTGAQWRRITLGSW